VGGKVDVSIEIGQVHTETPAQAQERNAADRRRMAVEAIERDENVQTLIESFNGKLDTQSIAPRGAGD